MACNDSPSLPVASIRLSLYATYVPKSELVSKPNRDQIYSKAVCGYISSAVTKPDQGQSPRTDGH